MILRGVKFELWRLKVQVCGVHCSNDESLVLALITPYVISNSLSFSLGAGRD